MNLRDIPLPGGTAAANATLEIRGLTAGYGSRPVLRNLHAKALPEASLTALLGPNGSGKSTLLKTLAGLNPMQGGTCLLYTSDAADE